MIDRETKFEPSEEEAYKLAKDYWDGLTSDREKLLENLSNVIRTNAKAGAYSITQVVPKKEEEYLKQKLEDVGYTVLFRTNPNDADKDFIIVSFNNK